MLSTQKFTIREGPVRSPVARPPADRSPFAWARFRRVSNRRKSTCSLSSKERTRGAGDPRPRRAPVRLSLLRGARVRRRRHDVQHRADQVHRLPRGSGGKIITVLQPCRRDRRARLRSVLDGSDRDSRRRRRGRRHRHSDRHLDRDRDDLNRSEAWRG